MGFLYLQETLCLHEYKSQLFYSMNGLIGFEYILNLPLALINVLQSCLILFVNLKERSRREHDLQNRHFGRQSMHDFIVVITCLFIAKYENSA